MSRRTEFHEKLCTLLGSRYVYFRAPENDKLNYPCIMYNINKIRSNKADNTNYINHCQYIVTYITKNVDDTKYYDILKTFPTATFDRFYRADNLNHYTITITY